MERVLDECIDVYLTTFTRNTDMISGRSVCQSDAPLITDGTLCVCVDGSGSEAVTGKVYLTLGDVAAVAGALREGVTEERLFSSVRVNTAEPKLLTGPCPVCGDGTEDASCVVLAQWEPVWEAEAGVMVHDECCAELAEALERVWAYTDEGLARAL